MRGAVRKPPRTVTIARLDTEGFGVGVDERGKAWRVRGAAPGAVVFAVGRTKAGIRVGTVSEAEGAVQPRCAVFGLCGGCLWQNLPLDVQRQHKLDAVRELLGEFGGDDHGNVGAGDGYGWRRKVDLSFGIDRYLSEEELRGGVAREGRWLGYHPPGHFDRIVDVEACPLVSPAMNAVLARVRADCLASPYPFYGPRDHSGFFRHLVLREGVDGVAAALVTAGGGTEHAAWFSACAPTWGARGVQWLVHDGAADAAVGRVAAVFGDPFVVEELAGIRYRLSPTAFFQVNAEGAEVLVAWVRRFAGTGGTLWDLYCGAGALGLACARAFQEVVGIEVNPAAAADAQANADANGVVGARFLAGEVEALVGSLPAPDVILLDPPRIGLHARALAAVAASDARVLVYVSCRSTSLLRDGRVLVGAGWRCTDRVVVDLFPQTAHVEVVTRWARG